ncbi:MAG TPA: hypothetical protein PKV06_05415, partial [bacterium]|nr:hypothetical protein [bacterium]
MKVLNAKFFICYKSLIIFLIVLLTFGALSCSCKGSDVIKIPDDEFRYFLIATVGNDFFIVRTSDSVIQSVADSLLLLPLTDRNMMIVGPIDRGNEDYNYDWNWHFKTNAWHFAETAMELCDGSPEYVEEHLDEWLSTV